MGVQFVSDQKKLAFLAPEFVGPEFVATPEFVDSDQKLACFAPEFVGPEFVAAPEFVASLHNFQYLYFELEIHQI